MDTEKALLRLQYEAKQRERAAEKNPLRKQQLFEEERTLRIRLEIPHPKAGIGGCYACGKPSDLTSDVWPFCSEACQNRWSTLNNYQERLTTGTSDLDIRKRQQRALEIVQEKREKRLGKGAVA